MKPYIHSKIHAKKYGGQPEDYGDFNEELIPKSVVANMKSLRRVLAKISGNVYKTMFDDHVTVIAT